MRDPSIEEVSGAIPPVAGNAQARQPPFWTRVQDNKVLQWGLAYLGAALALAHGGELLGHAFHWPEGANRLLIGALIVGFPVALALAWYHGHRSLKSISAGEATIISLLVLIGAGLLVVFVRAPEGAAHEAAGSAAHSEPPVVAAEKPAAAAKNALPLPKGLSIAVLPFVNMSSDREQEYFSDGLSEELLNQLSQLQNLRVIGRTSSFAFKGKSEDLRAIGETLGVNHILEGSVRKAGNHVRITAQLINPADGSHLWSDTYDRKLGDIFAIQEEIARTVAAALRISMGASDFGEAGTKNLEAYDAFLRATTGGGATGPQNLLAAIAHLERAVELDPQFTAAWVTLVDVYGAAQLSAVGDSTDWLRKQERAVNRAQSLAPNSPSVKLVLAGRELTKGNLIEAERLLAAVKDLPPSLSVQGYTTYAVFLMGIGRSRDALDPLMRVLQTEPLALVPSLQLQVLYEVLGEYDRADVEYERSLGFAEDTSILRGTAVTRAMGRRDGAALKKALAQLSPTDVFGGPINTPLSRLLDDPKAALVELRRIYGAPGFVPDTFRLAVVAQWAAYLGDPDLSLQALRRMPRAGVGAPSLSAMFTLWRPVEGETRRLPAFKDLVRELGLVDYWRSTGNWGEFCRPVGANDFECK